MTVASKPHQRDIVDRIRDTYFAAVDATHGTRSVEIHVGQAIWDHLQGSPINGFDVWLEMAWEPDRIEVRSRREIA